MSSKEVAYLLWLLWLFGLGGIHRFYAGKPLSGFIWLITWGFFGFGQLIDLVLIPSMIDEQNLKYLALRGGNQANTQTVVVNINESELQAGKALLQKPKDLAPQNELVTILQLAQSKGGSITLVDAVIATQKPTSEVKNMIKKCCDEGLMEIDNSESTGMIIYKLIQ